MGQSKISRGLGRDRKTKRRRAALCNPKPASSTVAAKNCGNTVPLVSENRPARARSPGKAILPLYQSEMWRERLNELDPVADSRRPRGQETPGRADDKDERPRFCTGRTRVPETASRSGAWTRVCVCRPRRNSASRGQIRRL